AAISVGILPSGEIALDLDYEQDATAKVDMNIVMTGSGNFVEIQGTGEEATFSYEELEELLAAAKTGIEQLFEVQKEVLGKLTEKIGPVEKVEEDSSEVEEGKE